MRSFLLKLAPLVFLTATALAVEGCGPRHSRTEQRAPATPSGVQVGYAGLLGQLDEAAAAGFDYVELGTAEIAQLSDAEFEQVTRRIREAGIPTPVSNLFIPGNIKLTGPDIDEAQQMEYVSRALDRMSRLGVEHIVFGSGGARRVPEGFSEQRAFAQLVDFGRRVAPEAQRRGITILVEPLRREETNIINTARAGLELVQAVDHPNFQLMVDFYHLASENEDPEIIEEARDHIFHLHMANPQGRAFPARWGEYDYRAFFETLRRIGFSGRVSIEARPNSLQADAPAAIRLVRQGLDPAFPLM